MTAFYNFPKSICQKVNVKVRLELSSLTITQRELVAVFFYILPNP